MKFNCVITSNDESPTREYSIEGRTIIQCLAGLEKQIGENCDLCDRFGGLDLSESGELCENHEIFLDDQDGTCHLSYDDGFISV